MNNINYPPEEILKPIVGKINFELIILWILSNNKICRWSDFKKVVKHSTLSIYLKNLKEQGYIVRSEFNKYQITLDGKRRFNEVSQIKKKERELNYPPRAIIKVRNYEHWILWMVYNNNYCKWVDFTIDDSPVKISQSSLSKTLNNLIVNNFIEKNNNEYQITKLGRAEYSSMLQLYDLDRQSILQEESKRIEELTSQTLQFFKKYEISDNKIRFRFLYNVLRLPFETVQHNFDNREDFYKVLLFLAMNHPNQYPIHINSNAFCLKFNIERLILDFHILQIVDKNIYPVKFFKLKVDFDETYYFQANEKIEKMLNAVIEEQISKFTYLNKLFEEIPDETFKFTMESTITEILNEICGSLFNEGLKNALYHFLPGYIRDLAYKVEREKKLIDTYDKLEGLIWQEVQRFDQYPGPQANLEKIYFVNPELLELLNPLYKSKINSILKKVQSLMDKKDFLSVLEILNKYIEDKQKSPELIIFKAIIFCYSNRNLDAINLIEKEITLAQLNQENVYISTTLIRILSFLALGNFEKALQLSKKLSLKYPNLPLSSAIRGIVYGYNIIYHYNEFDVNDNGSVDIDEYLVFESSNFNKSILYQLKSLILLEIKEFEQAIIAINKAIELNPSLSIYNSKIKILLYFNEYDDALKFLDIMVELFPEYEVEIKLKKAYAFKKMRNVESGLEIIDELIQLYPDNNELLNHKASWLQYLNQREQAIKIIKKLIDLQPKKGLFHDTYGEILMTFEEYTEAIEEFQKALELDPDVWYKFQTHVKIGICYKELRYFEKALENLQIGKELTEKSYCNQDIKEKWLSIANLFIKEILEVQNI
ncbi:MAG: hypothetical protein ACFFEY_20665 [Candidatus Thorarchaeota archaeon]